MRILVSSCNLFIAFYFCKISHCSYYHLLVHCLSTFILVVSRFCYHKNCYCETLFSISLGPNMVIKVLNLGIRNIKVIATIFLKCMHQFTVSLERIKGFFSLLFLHYFIISGSLTVDNLGDLKWYRLWLKFAFSQLIFMLRTFPYVYLMSMSSLLRACIPVVSPTFILLLCSCKWTSHPFLSSLPWESAPLGSSSIAARRSLRAPCQKPVEIVLTVYKEPKQHMSWELERFFYFNTQTLHFIKAKL